MDEADKVLTRSTTPEVVQVKKSLEKILEGVNQTAKPTERDLKGLPSVVFVGNQKMLEIVNAEGIGTLKLLKQTEASLSVAEGKGLEEGTVGGEAQFVLTTKNAEGRQCYNKHDHVSSAYIKIRHLVKTFGRSFTNKTNSKGPKIDPWGTPDVIVQ